MKKNRLKKVFILLLIGIVVLIVYTKYKEKEQDRRDFDRIVLEFKQNYNLTVNKVCYIKWGGR